MSREPSDTVVLAWARLARAQTKLLESIEGDLKDAGLPALGWYDALLELGRSSEGMRPADLENQLLLAQHNVSRLLARLETAGLVRRTPDKADGRAHIVSLTAAGRTMQKKMWPVYAAAIERVVGKKLNEAEAQTLAALLGKLIA